MSTKAGMNLLLDCAWDVWHVFMSLQSCGKNHPREMVKLKMAITEKAIQQGVVWGAEQPFSLCWHWSFLVFLLFVTTHPSIEGQIVYSIQFTGTLLQKTVLITAMKEGRHWEGDGKSAIQSPKGGKNSEFSEKVWTVFLSFNCRDFPLNWNLRIPSYEPVQLASLSVAASMATNAIGETIGFGGVVKWRVKRVCMNCLFG